mmetsp:Transcript_41566/g.97272  ORF Transcript_41566/g.97272 Transcript_41566/m.97272 type:complete len:531 (-) Transcript_41566:528-2120(-)
MTSESELLAKIEAAGEELRAAKSSSFEKASWEPLLKELLAAKAEYKTITGKDYINPGGSESGGRKKKKEEAVSIASSEKNKAKNAAKAAKKAEKEAAKARNRAAREEAARSKADKLKGGSDVCFGDAPLVRSAFTTDRVWTNVRDLTPSCAGKNVLVRGHVQTVRTVGRVTFLLLRSALYTVQAVCAPSSSIPNEMLQYLAALPMESVVDASATVTLPPEQVSGATQKMVELQLREVRCVSRADPVLPFQMEDALRPEAAETDVGAYDATTESSAAEGGRVGQEMRLNYRWIDLRTPANQAIFRIEAMVGTLFREYLTSVDFVEMHSPKLIAGSSEGGSDVFKLNYFDRGACLAQSPQLYKQMAAACGGFGRVYEVGPVFRAENSNTRRHLCEFTGLDLEMVINEHYFEVLDVLSSLFVYIFDGIKKRCSNELERVREQHPFEDLIYLEKTFRLTYKEGCDLLKEAGVEQGYYDDLSTVNEKKLGDIVKAKYGTDFFFMDKYPLAVRPFYTMPCPEVSCVFTIQRHHFFK